MYTVVMKAMKRPYLGNYTRYSNGRDTKMTAIPNFIFMFYVYKGFKCNILMLLTKKSYHIFVMLNTYKLAYVGFGLSTH